MNTGLKGFLFDKDGTLVDTHDLILESMRHATREVLGEVLPDERLMAKIGIPLAGQVKDFSDDSDVQRRLAEAYREFNHDRHDEMIAIYPGEIEAMDRIAATGAALGVVTSKMHWLAWRGLEVTGIAGYLSLLIGADDCPVHKPLPDPVLAGIKALGLTPAECAYVGDASFDIEAGNAAGCTTIAVTWGMGIPDDVMAACPDFVCNTFDELATLIERLSR